MSKRKRSSKRGQNEGSIYQRKDGRWTAAISLGYQNGKLKRKNFYGATRVEAQEKLVAGLRDRQQALPVADDRVTVARFLEQWLRQSAHRVRPKTLASYRDLVRLHIAPGLGHVKLGKLTPQQVQTLITDRLGIGLSPRSVAYIRGLLRHALSDAVKWSMVARNVAALTDAPRAVKPDINPMTLAESQRFLRACAGDRLEALFSVAVALGMRQGECLGLRWEDVDWQSGVLRVRQSLQRIGGKLIVSELKTKSSRRDLPLIASVTSALRAHRTRTLEEKLAAGSSWQESGFVFVSSVGSPLDARNIVRRYHALLKRAGLPRRRFHDLRHGCASLLLAQGVPLKTVSDILGHSGVAITADIYSHVIPEMRRSALDGMDMVLAVGE